MLRRLGSSLVIVYVANVALYAASTPTAHATETCEFYKRFLPKMYDLNCRGGGGKAAPKAGAGYSSFAGAFNLNPAAAPTEPSPYGLELIGSRPRRDDDPEMRLSFGVIKGFKKVGAAVATAGNDTFYGNDIMQRAFGTSIAPPDEPREAPKGKAPSFNLGTAFELGPDSGKGFVTPAIGVSVRYNKTTDTLGFGSGIAAGGGPFSVGFGIARERISNYLDPIWFYSALGGIKIGPVQFEYTQLWNSPVQASDGGTGYDFLQELRPIHIFTTTIAVRRAIISLAVRKLNYLQIDSGYDENPDLAQFHGSVQYQLFQHLALGYLYNHIPGMHSVAAQIFL